MIVRSRSKRKSGPRKSPPARRQAESKAESQARSTSKSQAGSKVNPKGAAALFALLAAFALMLVGLPGSEARLARLEPELNRQLASREYHIDPGELMDLMYNNKLHLFVIDVRDEVDFNLFHLRDAIWKPVVQMSAECCRRLRAEGIKVVLSNDEVRAEQAWKHLTANEVLNVYILAGGVNLWLDIYKDGLPGPPHEAITGVGDDTLRHEIDSALGHVPEFALPPHDLVGRREYPTKVKVARPVAVEGGGCG
ncbi:MAG: rhodanese-like domain-containing protein [bacterium]